MFEQYASMNFLSLAVAVTSKGQMGHHHCIAVPISRPVLLRYYNLPFQCLVENVCKFLWSLVTYQPSANVIMCQLMARSYF